MLILFVVIYAVYTYMYQGINEGDFYTFKGLFQLEQGGS